MSWLATEVAHGVWLGIGAVVGFLIPRYALRAAGRSEPSQLDWASGIGVFAALVAVALLRGLGPVALVGPVAAMMIVRNWETNDE